MNTRQEPVAHYGIIDPDYARVFTMARCLAWSEGYALAMHGSFTRDLDMIAVPWTDAACEPGHLVRRIADATDLKICSAPGQKPHGRLAFTLMFKGFADPRWVDLSVMPRQPAPEKPWVGLTDAEMSSIDDIAFTTTGMRVMRAIGAKLREKNA